MSFKNQYFVIDTSALLFDPTSLTYFTEGTVLLPVSVIQELDKHKDRQDHIGSIARSLNRQLYELHKLGDLSAGIKCPKFNVTIRVVKEDLNDVPPSLDKNCMDDRILSVCLTYLKVKSRKNKVSLLTNDLNLSLKAAAYGVKNFDFQPEAKYFEAEYKGHRELIYTEDLNVNNLFIPEERKIECPKTLNAIENEFFFIKKQDGKGVARCVNKNGFLHKLDDNLRAYKIKPLNNEQLFALHLLMDPKVKVVALTGLAGSGKTILSCAAGLIQTIEPDKRKYEKLILSRSLVVLAGKDKLGFLPGTAKEKLDPYLIPLRDAIDFILGHKANALDYFTATATGHDMSEPNKPRIEIEPLQYIKGRTLRSAYFIVDEAQNLSLQELKTIISRTDEFSKIILLGDADQIDNPYLNKTNNGLIQVIERFKGSHLFGHVALQEGIRSDVATLASKLL